MVLSSDIGNPVRIASGASGASTLIELPRVFVDAM
jgi:hypothetical protein